MRVPLSIAIIDDDEDVRTSLATLIESAGYLASAFHSALALLTLGDVGQFDCFISDVQMPGMDGLALAQEIIALTSAPTILITAFPSDSVDQRAAQAGVRYVIAKPFSPDRLLDYLTGIDHERRRT
jgi:CheY-like chemotaxis protein